MQTLRELREAAGVSIQQLADAIGVDRQAVYYWERGQRNISAVSLRRIARYFGVSMDDITLPGEEPADDRADRAAE